MGLMEVSTGGQTQDLFPIQLTLRQIFDILHTGGRIRIAGVADEPGQAIALPGTPLRIHQHGKAILKGHRLELRIL